MPGRRRRHEDRTVDGTGMHPAEDYASIAEAAAADRLARALVTGFGLCEDEGYPLNEIQRIELVKSALVTLVGVRAEVERQIRVSEAIRALERDVDLPWDVDAA